MSAARRPASVAGGALVALALLASGRVAVARPGEPPPAEDPPVAIVESGSPEAIALGERMEGLPDPFELPPIPVVESGSPEARALGERFSNPEAQRRREEAWRRDSVFPPNPDTVPGRYRFDLRLRQRVDSADGLVDMTCFVNSRDASLLCPDWGLTGWTLGVTPAQGTLDFVLRQADGDVLACGQHRDLGAACLQLGEQLGPGFAWLRNSTLHGDFLESIASTPQTLREGPGGLVQGVRGRTADGFLQLWVDRRASPVATRMPWLGLGVGVMRDERARVLRTVRRARFEGADRDGGDVVLDLVELEPARIERDLAGYRVVTAFTAQGLDEAMPLAARLMAMQREGAGIRAELEACPSGRAGSDCRAHHRERLKALEQRARDMALGFGQRHGLPVED
jgi:hypothetical protein